MTDIDRVRLERLRENDWRKRALEAEAKLEALGVSAGIVPEGSTRPARPDDDASADALETQPAAFSRWAARAHRVAWQHKPESQHEATIWARRYLMLYAAFTEGIGLSKSETTTVTNESPRTQTDLRKSLNELKDACIPLIEYFDDRDWSERGLDVPTSIALAKVRARVFGDGRSATSVGISGLRGPASEAR